MNVRPHTSKSTPLNALDLDHDGMVTANGDCSLFLFISQMSVLKVMFLIWIFVLDFGLAAKKLHLGKSGMGYKIRNFKDK